MVECLQSPKIWTSQPSIHPGFNPNAIDNNNNKTYLSIIIICLCSQNQEVVDCWECRVHRPALLLYPQNSSNNSHKNTILFIKLYLIFTYFVWEEHISWHTRVGQRTTCQRCLPFPPRGFWGGNSGVSLGSRSLPELCCQPLWRLSQATSSSYQTIKPSGILFFIKIMNFTVDWKVLIWDHSEHFHWYSVNSPVWVGSTV